MLPTGNQLPIKMVGELLDTIRQGLHVVDAHGRTLLYNKTMQQLESTEDLDLLDKRLEDVFHFHPDENSTLLQALATKKPILNVRQTYFNANGKEITTLNDTYPLIVDGVLTGAVEIAREIGTVQQTVMNDPSLSSFDHWVGRSPLIRDMILEGKRISMLNESILLVGPPGSGKERLAQCIHLERRLTPARFLLIDCRTVTGERFAEAISPLFTSESEMTLYFVHVEETGEQEQTALTAALQFWKKHRRDQPGVYPVLSLNMDPIDAIQSGALTKELYYSMNENHIFVPGLSERKEDITALTEFFIRQYNQRYQQAVSHVEKEVVELFESYDWPGNVRELEHVMEASLLALGSDGAIAFRHLPHYFRLKFSDPANELPELDSSAFTMTDGKPIQTLDAFLQEAESYYLQKLFEYHQYNVTKTADALGMSRQNLQYRLKKHKLIRQTAGKKSTKKTGIPN